MRKLFSFMDYVILIIAVAGSGIIYSLLEYGGGAVIGATYTLFTCLPLLAFERGYILSGVSQRISGLPTPGFILAGLLVFLALMSTGFAMAGTLLWAAGIFPGSLAQAVDFNLNHFIFGLSLCTVIVLVMRVRELLGRDIFGSLLIGRYRRPIREERVFMFVDIAGSTAFAETHGDLRAQEYIGAVFATMAGPVRRSGGSVGDYVGDSAIITWPYEDAIRRAACIRCAFGILSEIESRRHFWIRKFGEIPQLRIAMHGGQIITAEIGVDHHKITWFGDTINTASRLEVLAKQLGKQVIISAELANDIEFPGDISNEYLGEHMVRGRDLAIGVRALSQVRR